MDINTILIPMALEKIIYKAFRFPLKRKRFNSQHMSALTCQQHLQSSDTYHMCFKYYPLETTIMAYFLLHARSVRTDVQMNE
ncbi:hypothetical protein TNCV_3402181 [Trichonephila clavipes]|nr:hypothetical protein TNCV_3402181 [Trichonephila clavipes]